MQAAASVLPSPALGRSPRAGAHAAPHQAGGDVIEALGKGLRVIEAFNQCDARMTASEAGDVAGISRAAARRYLLSLCHFGYAETDGRRFWLSPRVLRLGQGYLEAARLPRLVQPFLERLSMVGGQGASMSVLDDHEVVFLGLGRNLRAPAAAHAVGSRLPGHVVAAGYAALSTRANEEAQAWAARHEFTAFTPRTVRNAEQFLREVELSRRRGYARCDEQLQMGLTGIAVALRDRKGQCVGALSLTLHARDASHEEVEQRYLPPLFEASESIRHIL